MSRAPWERVRFITLIMACRVVKLHDDPALEIISIIEDLRRDLRACAQRSGFLKRGTRWCGTVEIDLVHWKLLGSDTKQDLVGTLAGVDPRTLTHDERVIVIHTHFVVDCRGHLSPEHFVRDMREQWPGPRRVRSDLIWREGTVAENLERIAGYCTKLRFQHSQAWEGKRTKFFATYGLEWKAWMQRLIGRIGLQNMLVSSVVSRAARCPLQNAETLSTQDVEPVESRLQLKALDQTEKSFIDIERDITNENRAAYKRFYHSEEPGELDCLTAAPDPEDERGPAARSLSQQAPDAGTIAKTSGENPQAARPHPRHSDFRVSTDNGYPRADQSSMSAILNLLSSYPERDLLIDIPLAGLSLALITPLSWLRGDDSQKPFTANANELLDWCAEHGVKLDHHAVGSKHYCVICPRDDTERMMLMLAWL